MRPLQVTANDLNAEWFVSESMADAAVLVAAEIVLSAAESILLKGRFDFLATGGESARFVYRELLGQVPSWENWQIYLSDERCVSVDSHFRNDKLIREELVDRTSILPSQVHLISGELGAIVGARRYADEIGSIKRFDMALLGFGEDGHVASLFPNMTFEDEMVVPVHNAPKPPSERISVSARVLSATRRIIVIAGGEAKRAAVAQLHSPDAFFWKTIGSSPRVTFFFDRNAMPAEA